MAGTADRGRGDEWRRARQEVRTSLLLGIDFVPTGVARAASDVDGEGPASLRFPSPKPGVNVEPKSGRSFGAGVGGGGGGVGGLFGGVDRGDVEPASEALSGTDKSAALAALLERYRTSTDTAAQLIEGWTNIVFHDGDPDAALMFIGEAPGADEDASGVPFVGRAGQKLNEMIRAMGLSRESVYIANVLKVRPPNNRDPSAHEKMADGPYLREQIRIVRPRAIVTLGRPASTFVLGRDASMGSLRGRWSEYEGAPVMPTYHPAYLLRSYTPENRQRVWSDLQQVMVRLGLDG